jgi:hypothetical protein
MSEPHYKVCPVCRTEYLLVAARCADCDVDLVDAEALVAEDRERKAFPPASELECVRVAPIGWIQALSRALQEQGVPHRVEPANAEDAPDGQRPEVFGDARLFGLYVESERVGTARDVDDTIAAHVLPEAAPPLAEGEEEACPACGTALPASATECPDCGLVFG